MNNFDNATAYTETLKSCLLNIGKLEERVKDLEKKEEQHAEFYRESARLSKTSRISLIVLMIVPVVQLLVCAIIVYSMGLEEKLPNILKWFLGGVSLLSVVEMIMTIIKGNSDKQKFDELEKEIEKLKKGE